MLKIAFDKIYTHPLDENHRFPMIKYDFIPEQLLRENTCNQDNFFIPSKLDDYNALLTHDKDYYALKILFSYNEERAFVDVGGNIGLSTIGFRELGFAK